MTIIPVIDLRSGIVVRALRGQRQNYQPLQTPLCSSYNPHDVISALNNLFPFEVIYIADLDAIQGTGDQRVLVASLVKDFPRICFWIDAGFVCLSEVQGWRSRCDFKPVIGTEKHDTLISLQTLFDSPFNSVLSLDYLHDRLQGPAALLECPNLWPDDVIVMELDRVGTQEGPNLPRLRSLQTLAPGKRIYCSGGVRHYDDLEALSQYGVCGALLSTALHKQQITSDNLGTLHKKMPRT